MGLNGLKIHNSSYTLPKANTTWWFEIFFIFIPIGEMIQFDEHIFQMGWNQLELFFSECSLAKWMVGWEMNFILGPGLFSGPMLVSGRVLGEQKKFAQTINTPYAKPDFWTINGMMNVVF